MEKFLIIDGNSLAFRAFYALPYLTSANGQHTGAVFGFMNMFLKVLDEYQPTHVVIAFDFSRKTFRNEWFSEYKGTRKETPDELRSQFPILKNLLKLMNINVVEKQGIEADDIIGTFAKNTNCEKVILSGDRDVLQLIDNSTQVWLTQKGISEIHKTTEDVLMKENGITPLQVIELKALMGDNSDNIPGVQGIGPKTATTLIQQFGDIETLFENLDNPNISTKMKQKLEENKDIAFLSKKLATIKTDCDIDTYLECCKLTLPFGQEAITEIQELDMTSLLKKTKFFGKNIEEKILQTEKFLEIKNIETLDEIKEIISKTKSKQFAFNIDETLCFSFNENFAYNIEGEVTLFSAPPDIEECLNILKPILEDKNVEKVVCDYKSILHKLEKFDIKLNGEIFDINLANYLLGNKFLKANEVEKFFSIKKSLQKDLMKNQLEKIYYEMELPLENVLFEMENNGFKIDKQILFEQSQKVENELQQLHNKITKMSGENFNINSPKQLAEVLFEKLHLPTENNPKLSTGVEILNDLVDCHPIINEILKYRKLQKLKSTYIDSFLQIIDKTKSDIIHTIFNQTLTATGRLSSSEPNLQNIPVRDEEGKEIRKMFVSRFDDGQLVSADYNQIELRLLAHCSEDEKLIDAFNSGKDVHKATAMEIFCLKENEVLPEIRRRAKAVNFGVIYGISGVGLAQNTGISRAEATEYIKKYFEIYPNVKKYMDGNVDFAKKYGFVKTIFNRRRKIPELKADNHQIRQFGERVAKNMPLQGSASDIIKFAMLKVANELTRNKLQAKLVLQIHDELVIDSPKNEISQVKKILKDAMENVVSLKVKLPVEIESGKTYYEI